MANIRSGNMHVYNMKKEIIEYLDILRRGYISKRRQRQLSDGAKFLEMMEATEYAKYTTVSELKQAISNNRNKLKQQLDKLACYEPGYQYSLFEQVDDVSEDEWHQIQLWKKELTVEIQWLHKCLGICSNRDYFK